MAHMDTKPSKGSKVGERTEFCYNCKYVKKPPKQKHCVDCFGTTNTGKLFSHVNWVESKEYHKPMRIL